MDRFKLMIPGVLLVALSVWIVAQTEQAPTPDTSPAMQPDGIEDELSERRARTARTRSPRSSVGQPITASEQATPSTSTRPDAAELTARELHERKTYQRLRAMEHPGPLHQHMMQHLEKVSRYPRTNRRFDSAEVDPIAQTSEPRRRHEESPDGEGSMQVWSDAQHYLEGDAITVYATVQQQGEPSDASLEATLHTPDGKTVASLPFGAPDEQGVRQLALAGLDGQPLPAKRYKLRVHCELGMSQTLMIPVSQADGHLTGAYRDRIVDGDLVVEAELEVYREGTYHVQGSLYAGEDTPVGHAETSQEFTVGTRWIALRYHGRLLHDGGREGPFVMRHLRVARRAFPAAAPIQESPNHMTDSYALEQFRDRPHNDLLASAQ